jgi:exodeoxyribonuclease III
LIHLRPIPNLKPGCIKIVSWNVAGWRASLRKGFDRYLDAENADIVLLQETKLSQDLDYMNPIYPYIFQNHSLRRKGYSGTAILSKIEPLSVEYLKLDECVMNQEGRHILLEFRDYFMLNSYIPFAGRDLERLVSKRNHLFKLKEFLMSVKKPIIWGGDLNVAHQSIDLFDPQKLVG